MKGKIIKGIAGFYYVHVADDGHTMGTVYECKAKGVFRKDHRKPLVGDDVEMDVLDEAQKKGNIRELLPRHSELIRPAVANVDQALVIFAITKPQPNFNLLDRFLVMMQQQDIPCIICFNKQDIDEEGKKEDYRAIYEQAGFRTITVSAARQEGIDTIQELLRGKTTTVAGPSGVGKSSLVNRIAGREAVIVSDIAGTTRDATDTVIENQYGKFVFIDTAGIRRKSKVEEAIEKYSVLRAYMAVDRSNVCIIMIDATKGFSEQDSKIAGYAHEQGKACIIAINKWKSEAKRS